MSNSHENDGAAAGGGADAAAAAAAAAQAAGNNASLLEQGAGKETDWLPSKFRVNVAGSDQLDLDASARKLATSYAELEKTRPSGTVPATAGEYKLEVPKDAEGKELVQGVDLEDFMADPLFKGLSEKAHALGISNETMQFFVGEYLQFMPALLEANGQISSEDAAKALRAVWTDDAEFNSGLQRAARAAQGFGAEPGKPGSFDNLMAKFGNDPDFLAFAARIGAEMGEDKPINADPAAEQDWQAQVDEIRANPAYMDAKHPQHKQLSQKMEQLYQRRYGTRQQQLGASATR
ncbi:hypothetical protein ATCM_03020 [Stenotrophomonas sp. ATCM1_4]|nr:hypothetical protein ATCM_03020 [Stenotrophomonas sp. ATCM1_4]